MHHLHRFRSAALLACLVVAFAACARTIRVPEPIEHASFVEELREARLAPACPADLAAIDTSWAEYPVPSEVRGVRLPALFVPAKRERESVRSTWAWRGADSTMVTLMLTGTPPGPIGGIEPVVGDGGLFLRLPEGGDMHSEVPCRLEASGSDVKVTRWVNSHPADPDSVFGMSATMFVRHGLVVNMVAITPTRAMRDSLVGSLLSARLETSVATR